MIYIIISELITLLIIFNILKVNACKLTICENLWVNLPTRIWHLVSIVQEYSDWAHLASVNNLFCTQNHLGGNHIKCPKGISSASIHADFLSHLDRNIQKMHAFQILANYALSINGIIDKSRVKNSAKW